MDHVLAQIVVDRLAADPSATEEQTDLVLAALEGDDELAAILAGGTRPRPHLARVAIDEEPAGAYLKSVTVEGFRGIGPPTRLDITAAPGLTLVVGRNGSGKSSLAEGLEVLLTGDSRRWAGRSQVWKEGWRNLHHGGATRIAAEFVEEGREGGATVNRMWSAADELEAGGAHVQRPGGPTEELSALKWSTALDAYRPFLSYNELGSMLDEAPSKLYDAMAGILGLEDLVAAERRLGDQRRAREKASKEVAGSLKLLRGRLGEIDDARTRQCVEALSGKRVDLDAVEKVLGRSGPGEAGADLEVLRQLSALEAPDPARASVLGAALRAAAADAAKLEGTDADGARRTADILEAAAAFHDVHGDGECPVCGRSDALDAKWHAAASLEIDRLRRMAKDADAAYAALSSASHAVADVCVGPPALLDAAAELGVDGAAAGKAWAELAMVRGTGQQDPEHVAAVLERVVPQLATAVAGVREAALADLQRREDSWRPVALELRAWLEKARVDESAAAGVPALRKAEKWLKDAAQVLRDERFAPIAEEAARLWGLLRMASNVDLGGVELAGSATQRKVVLAVTVDGADGAALGVMSQGRAPLAGVEPLPAPRHASGEPVPLPRDRRPRAVDGPRARRRARSSARGDRTAATGARVHARRPATRGRPPPRNRRHRLGGGAP